MLSLFMRPSKSRLSLLLLCPRYLSGGADSIQAGDRVLLQLKGKDPFITEELHQDGKTNLQHGHISHSEIIGRNERDIVKSNRGADLRAYLPTLAEYVTLTPRIVTPIYPADANLIVSLLDIHASPVPSFHGPPSFEILEAGTGHGGLTLYLARAIHAANALRSKADSSGSRTSHDPQLASCCPNGIPTSEKPSAPDDNLKPRSGPFYEHKSDDRQAVIHTVDVSQRNSEYAEKTINGFRQGLYANDIVFHVGDVSQWIDEQVYNRGLGRDQKAFLSHIVLDMPSSSQHIEKAASVLHTNGTFLAFNPSITQIIALVKIVKQLYLPLVLSSVLELEPNSGGREWDLRAVIPRALTRGAKASATENDVLRTADEDLNDGLVADLAESNSADRDNRLIHENENGVRTICRPKVGYRVAGGGFLGVWRKMKMY